MKHAAGLTLTLFAAWLLWSGHYTPMLLGLGAASCVLVVALLHRMEILDPQGQPLHLIVDILRYLPWLLKEVVISNLDVARRILRRSPRISPCVVRVRALQKTPLGQVIFANSITLTPGTLALRLREGHVVVHALTREGAAALEEGEMNRRVRDLEGTAP